MDPIARDGQQMAQPIDGHTGDVLGEDAARIAERDAQEYNIRAALAVADAVRSTYGPKGMDKMLVSDVGTVTITNDGETLLRQMEIENPTAEMLVEIAQTQANEAGDGTTTVVILAAALLKQAMDLIEDGLHPNVIVRGFTYAANQAFEEVDDIAVSVDGSDREVLRQVAETAMTGKGVEVDRTLLADLVIDAVEAVTVTDEAGDTFVDRRFIEIEPQTGHPAADSKLVHGMALHEDAAVDDMPSLVEDARILLTDQALEHADAEIDARISIDDPTAFQSFVDEEDAALEAMVDQITAAGANVVVCQHGIDDLARFRLAAEGVLAIPNVDVDDLDFLRSAVDAPLVSDLDAVTAEDLGIGRVERDAHDELFFIEGTGEEAHGVTLLVRGSTDHVVEEVERAITDALQAVTQTVVEDRVLPGGGAVAIEVARRVREEAPGLDAREQLALEGFADAIEMTPYVLAENAGIDPIETVMALRNAHADGDVLTGIDVVTDDVVDMVERGILDTPFGTQQAIAAATEAACMIIKIDDIITPTELREHVKDSVAEDGPV